MKNRGRTIPYVRFPFAGDQIYLCCANKILNFLILSKSPAYPRSFFPFILLSVLQICKRRKCVCAIQYFCLLNCVERCCYCNLSNTISFVYVQKSVLRRCSSSMSFALNKLIASDIFCVARQGKSRFSYGCGRCSLHRVFHCDPHHRVQIVVGFSTSFEHLSLANWKAQPQPPPTPYTRLAYITREW